MTWRPSAEKACASTRLPRRCRAPQRPRQRNDSALRARAPMIGLTTYAEDEMHDDAVSTAVADRTAGGVAELGTILGIWAHPDDEAYLSGGLMAMARDNGSRVVCVTATRGELGTPDPAAWPPRRPVCRRRGVGRRDGAVRADRLGPPGHGADLRPGRHHRPSGPPGGVGV